MPWHLLEDQVMNRLVVQGENIGTTLRGIGPCYRDKVGRNFAFRMIDLLQPDLEERIATIAEAKRALLTGMGASDLAGQLDAAVISEQARRWSSQLGPLIGDTTNTLLDELDAGKRLLMEGAQGSLLDIDHGTYPFVTSSNSSGVGINGGSGIPSKWVRRVIGSAKPTRRASVAVLSQPSCIARRAKKSGLSAASTARPQGDLVAAVGSMQWPFATPRDSAALMLWR